MEPITSSPSIFLLSSEKGEIQIFDSQPQGPKLIGSFNSQHTAKISCMVPVFTPTNTLQSIITFSYDKQVKVWNQTSPNNFSLKNQCSTPKKNSKSFVDSDNQVLFCDKYGDIFTFNPTKLNPNEIKFEATQIMGNLAMIKLFQIVQFYGKKYLLISDEYFRIKICRFPEIYDILSIWIPFEFIAKSSVVLNDGILLMCRSEEKKYRICWISHENFENPECVYSDILFPDRVLEEFQEEKREIFLIDQQEKEIGILQQTIEKDRVLIEIKVCIFDEKAKKLIEIRNVRWENKDSVKIHKVEKNRVLLGRKSNAEKEMIERRVVTANVEIFEEKNLYVLSVKI